MGEWWQKFTHLLAVCLFVVMGLSACTTQAPNLQTEIESEPLEQEIEVGVGEVEVDGETGLIEGLQAGDEVPLTAVEEEVVDEDAVLQNETVTDDVPVTNRIADFGFADSPDGFVRFTQFLDFEVDGPAGEDVGGIEDVVVELSTGRIPYVILEIGGFLEIGDEDIAVPPSALQWTMGATEDEFLLRVDPAYLEGVPSVEDSWPEWGEPAWDDELYPYWGDLGLPTFYDFQTDAVMRASNLIGYRLGDLGFGIANIDDMVIDLTAGRISYAFIDYASAGIGDELLVVPFPVFDVGLTGGEDIVFAPDMGVEILEEAPRIDRVDFADPYFDASFDDEIEAFWEEAGIETD